MTYDHKAMFEAIQAKGAIKVQYKNESRLMRCCGALMFYNRTFMTNCITTIGETVYFPSREMVERDYSAAWATLCHELVHIEDYRRSKPRWLWSVLYAMPQALAVLALPAAFLLGWWSLLFLLFLAPLPAPWRRNAEMRGYAMDMAVWFWYKGSGIPQGLKQDIVKHFTSAEYYFMYPFKAKVTTEVNRWSKKVLCNEMDAEGDVFPLVRSLIASRTSRKL